MARGTFIVLEGIDGAGTTTQLRRLDGVISALGHTAQLTAEPSDGPIGRFIRTALRGEAQVSGAGLALLYAADRLEHLAQEIEPHLQRGHVVVSDRYLVSSLAYQSTDVPEEWVRQINARAPMPDVTLYFRVAPSIAAERRRARGGKEERFETAERQERVAAAYERLFAADGSGDGLGQVVIIDAAQTLTQVSSAVDRAVAAALAARGDDAGSDDR